MIVVKDQEKITLSVTPFTSEVIGADDKFVYLRENYVDGTGKDNYCVIKVGRADFIEMIELWLDAKAGYTKRYNHFCGVMGNFYIDKYIERGEINLLTGFNEEKEETIYEDVPLYEVVEFDKHCDMEHG